MLRGLFLSALLATAAQAHGPEELPAGVTFAAPGGGESAPTAEVLAPRRYAGPLPLQPGRKVEFDTDEGTWISVDAGPDGGLVFELMGDLYALDAKGGLARPITHGLPFDTQPAISPDGAFLAFVSDRSGSDNLWIAGRDGSGARELTAFEGAEELSSVAWSPDGKTLYASRYRSDLNAVELWRFDVATGNGEELMKGARSALGAAPSPDGRYLYYAGHSGPLFEDNVTLPQWAIRRLDLSTGEDLTVMNNMGSAMRPKVSPDGRSLVYAARLDRETGLRMRDLASGADRWLAYPVERDMQEGTATRDLIPGYAFSADGKSLVIAAGGKIRRIDMASGRMDLVPFQAKVSLDIGPSTRRSFKDERGPVQARVIQAPTQSPDGKRLAFAAFSKIWIMDLTPGAKPRRLTKGTETEYQPTWSPDGRSLAYVTWTARDAGQVLVAPFDGRTAPRRVTSEAAFYTNPTFAPDGRNLLALRSSQYERMHLVMEYGLLRNADLIELPVAGGAARSIIAGSMSGPPTFGPEAGKVWLNFADGISSVALDGSGRRKRGAIMGAGWYFVPGQKAAADDVRISPDGKWALAQIAYQLHLVALPQGLAPIAIDLENPTVPHRKLTSVGADFFGWADNGRTITWAVGSTYQRRSLSSITLDQPGPSIGKGDRPEAGEPGVETFHAVVDLPRDKPSGAVVLRGGTALTMRGEEVIADADVVIVDDRIQAIGKRGTVAVPAGAEIRDVSGQYLTPGLVDTHLHWAGIRRGILDLESWDLLSTLAYGVTSGLDPSTLSIDAISYGDAIAAGQMPGPRLYSTSTAVFTYNRFDNPREVHDVLTRYSDRYRTGNLKMYRTGGRTMRQWIVMGAKDLGLMPTTEGAVDMKLELTNVMDGYAGSEHALPAYPLYKDVVQLFAQTRTSYTPTLQISHGGPPALNAYVAANLPHEDAKIGRFYPHYMADKLFTRLHWYDPEEYAYPRIAAGAAAIQRAGGLVGVGSHGNMPGIGTHFELQALASGGMTPMEVLRAGTIGSAETIGREAEVGSLEPGKYADILILKRNPLEDVKNTLSLLQVVKGGRIYDAATLDEVWPRPRPRAPFWFADDRPPAGRQ
jgi:Tol biopolymer transport system component